MNAIVNFKGYRADRHACASSNICRMTYAITVCAPAGAQKGELYSKKSIINLRYGIQKRFLKIRDFDIVNHESFKAANTIFLSMLMKRKQEGNGVSIHKPRLVSII
jgi:hypothetical protein